MTDARAWKPKLRTVLGVVVGVLLAAVGAVLVIVLQNVDATAEMRKEAREALLLAEMDTSVQRIAVAVDAWISGDLSVDAEFHPVLGRTDIQQERAAFDRAAAELGFVIKPAERFLVEDMERMLANYEAALVALHASGDSGVALLTAFQAGPQPIERSFREALLELQNEEIEHLAESAEAVKAAETKLRFLVPALLVLVVISPPAYAAWPSTPGTPRRLRPSTSPGLPSSPASAMSCGHPSQPSSAWPRKCATD